MLQLFWITPTRYNYWQLLQHVTIIVTLNIWVFFSGFTSAGVAAGSLAAAFQATIGCFTFFLFLCPFLKNSDCLENEHNLLKICVTLL